ncbi:DUF5081 family protein [Camelliibacillus cellulosilyticus]|uniref:DUF5081 family protein n=1 Tax=Camelliibacillus cellulosilyticus TaxID=2174486 RepID=A0ABV9GUF9_9BACL
MSDTAADFFTVPELYLLASAFEGNVLFGLPDKSIYQLRGEFIFEEAKERLMDKGILGVDGDLTKAGASVIQALETYHHSQKYVRINNLMFAFFESDHNRIVALVEIQKQRAYQLRVLPKVKVFDALCQAFPFILREPKEEEKTFLVEALTYHEKQVAKAFKPQQVMNLESFRDRNDSNAYGQWLFFMADRLISVDIVHKKYYRASQYAFLKLLFDEMSFPYGERGAMPNGEGDDHGQRRPGFND